MGTAYIPALSPDLFVANKLRTARCGPREPDNSPPSAIQYRAPNPAVLCFCNEGFLKMAQHICPLCQEKKTTWHIDWDVSQYTQWFCRACEETVFEDESKLLVCNKCENKTWMYCWYGDKKFRWCTSCNSIDPIEPATSPDVKG